MSVAFCVGTGRCGTTFLSRVAAEEPGVAASHERLRLSATFHMYCAWNEIPVDPEGFLVDRRLAVAQDLRAHAVSFESSALLSHSVAPLDEAFAAQWVLLVRRPDHTVGSFAVRHWYPEPPALGDPGRPPSYREGQEPRHFFGRMLPRGAEGWARFCAATPLGRIAWFWQARNRAILRQLAALEPDRVRVVRLEELDVDGYRALARHLGWAATISDERFEGLVGERINAGPRAPRAPEDWTASERQEFEREVADVAAALGYEHRLDALAAGAPVLREPVPTVQDAWRRLAPDA